MSTFLRLAPHVHSTWSHDGVRSLGEIAGLFGRLRYDAVLMCEHDVDLDEERWAEYRAACAAASTDRVLLIPGVEYSDPGNVLHVPVWGPAEFLGARRPTDELLDRVEAAGGYAVLAHPIRRNAYEAIAPSLLARMHAIEVYNRKYDGVAPGRAALALLRAHPSATPVAALDYHRDRQLFPAWTAVRAQRDGDAIVAALRDESTRWRVLGLPAGSLGRPPVERSLRALDHGRRTVLRLTRTARRGRAA